MFYFGVVSAILNVVLGTVIFAGCYCWWKGLLPSPKPSLVPETQPGISAGEEEEEGEEVVAVAVDPPRPAGPAVLEVARGECVDVFPRVRGLHLLPPPPYFEDEPAPIARPRARSTYWADSDRSPERSAANPFGPALETPPPRYETRSYEMRARNASARSRPNSQEEEDTSV